MTEQRAARAHLPRLEDLDDLSFSPADGVRLSYGHVTDPYPKIHELAASNWVHEVEFKTLFGLPANGLLRAHYDRFFTVVGYDKVTELVQQPDLFSNRLFAYTLGTSFGRTLTAMDAPEHQQYRRIFQKAFLPQTVRKWGDPIVAPVVDALLDKVADKGRADLVQDFTFHYPFQVIYAQLDLPPQDAPIFHKLGICQTHYHYAPDIAAEAGRKLGVYFTNMVRQRRADPGEDMVSALASAEADGEQLPEEVVVSFLRQLTNAAGDTTYRGTSVLLAALLRNPDQLEAVRQDRSLVPAAIEEALRWDGPMIMATRVTTREATIDGFTFPANAVVDLINGSASRDPGRYAEPDRFDVFRSHESRHMAFATGPHLCIGQHLARVEMERALNAILDRLPNLRLDPDMPPPEIMGYNMRVPHHLHVRFG